MCMQYVIALLEGVIALFLCQKNFHAVFCKAIQAVRIENKPPRILR